MFFGLSDDQRVLRDSLTQVLRDACPPRVVRAAWDGRGSEITRALTDTLARVGVLGSAVSERADGLGMSEDAAWSLWAALGHAAVPAPAVETMAVVAPLLEAAGPGSASDLAAVLDGSLVATCVVDDELVSYGPWADLVIHLDRDTLVASIGRGQGLALEPVRSVDRARPLARLVRDEALSPLPVESAQVAGAVDRMVLASAAQLVGLSRRMLEMTVEYVQVREQFGQAVGGFQAVKHALATSLLRTEEAESCVANAAWVMAHRPSDTVSAVAVASLFAREAGELAASSSIQCHGAMAYTLEYDLHLYAKRAWALASSWGSAEEQVDRVIGVLGLEVAR